MIGHVAELYGVETRDINKAVKNNPDKFPDGYTFVLNKSEFEDLRWKFSTTKFSKTRVCIAEHKGQEFLCRVY
jgi:hypothetical protein